MISSRREFIKLSAACGATALLPFAPLSALAAPRRSEPHFFLQYCLPGGFDWSYLFDARPLSMTQAGLIQNYSGKEPSVWEGVNGTKALVTEAADSLKPLKDYFSVLNGVHMSLSFNGHAQNLNYLLAGNPFGGPCFLPELNHRGELPIDGVQNGTSFQTLTNMGGFVPLTGATAEQLVGSMQRQSVIEPGSRKWKHVLARFAANASAGGGSFSLASRLLLETVPKAALVEEVVRNTRITTPASTDPASVPFMNVITATFLSGLSKSALIFEDLRLDTHAPADAKQNPVKALAIATRIKAVIEALRSTPYDSTRSLYDVTTFMFNTEFNRTLRQPGTPIDETGTDHNSYSNTLVIGGKGIRGGWVVGESDFASELETLSAVHTSLDPRKLMTVGRAFDFAALKPRTAAPSTYDVADYLGIGSVINTIYASFGVPEAKWRLLGRSLPPAPVLKGLLA
ncbi:MAG TPA: DUF1501 domain-containing protein [Bdellovibrionota bacterium]|nr:DUF1501 domain-containing protein [Bdellovibrionota bacterium]